MALADIVDVAVAVAAVLLFAAIIWYHEFVD